MTVERRIRLCRLIQRMDEYPKQAQKLKLENKSEFKAERKQDI